MVIKTVNAVKFTVTTCALRSFRGIAPRQKDGVKRHSRSKPRKNHFLYLVSTLNRILCIKSDLDILQDAEGQRIRRAGYELRAEGDELSLLDDEGIPFEYKPGNPERSRIQEAIFNEKRTIIENCLFGVDLNPNSVNICRLRLWIELLKNAYYTKESGYTRLETLPNIDINIKVGDSLLSYYPVVKGRAVFDKELAKSFNEYRACVKEYKEGTTKNFSKMLLRQKIKALKSRLMEPANTNLWGEEEKTQTIDYTNSLEWSFEFPEVLDGSGKFIGFDAVIGNPPYVQLQEMGKMSDVYASKNYACYNKSADLYCLFVERGYSLLKENGFMSMIMPNKWMLVDYGKNLRTFMSQMALQKILNFGDIQFFDDATTYVCIFVVQKSAQKKMVTALSLDAESYKGDFEKEVSANLVEFAPEKFGESEWSIRNPVYDAILKKMNVGTALKDSPIRIYAGIKAGCVEAFYIDETTRKELVDKDPKCAEIIRPLLRGRDVLAWITPKNELYLIGTFPAQNLDIDQYPVVKAHLLSFGIERLEQTGATHEVNGVIIKARKKTCNKWFETQDQVGYYAELAKPKIIFPNITTVFPFSYDEKGISPNDNNFFIVEKNPAAISTSLSECKNESCNTQCEYPLLKALLAIFNSKLVKLWIWYNCPVLNGGTRKLQITYFENLCIPTQNVGIMQKLATLANQIIAAKTADPKADTSAIEEQINALVYKAYGLSEEEIKAVETIQNT